jgi:hypothetical protein
MLTTIVQRSGTKYPTIKELTCAKVNRYWVYYSWSTSTGIKRIKYQPTSQQPHLMQSILTILEKVLSKVINHQSQLSHESATPMQPHISN